MSARLLHAFGVIVDVPAGTGPATGVALVVESR
jgi:hypothetical protein